MCLSSAKALSTVKLIPLHVSAWAPFLLVNYWFFSSPTFILAWFSMCIWKYLSGNIFSFDSYCEQWCFFLFRFSLDYKRGEGNFNFIFSHHHQDNSFGCFWLLWVTSDPIKHSHNLIIAHQIDPNGPSMDPVGKSNSIMGSNWLNFPQLTIEI